MSQENVLSLAEISHGISSAQIGAADFALLYLEEDDVQRAVLAYAKATNDLLVALHGKIMEEATQKDAE